MMKKQIRGLTQLNRTYAKDVEQVSELSMLIELIVWKRVK